MNMERPPQLAKATNDKKKTTRGEQPKKNPETEFLRVFYKNIRPFEQIIKDAKDVSEAEKNIGTIIEKIEKLHHDNAELVQTLSKMGYTRIFKDIFDYTWIQERKDGTVKMERRWTITVTAKNNKFIASAKPTDIVKPMEQEGMKNYTQYKRIVLEHFEKIWRKKDKRTIIGEYVHMSLIAKEYKDYKKKSAGTDDPEQYKHAFKSFLEFSTDRIIILRKILTDLGVKFTKSGEIKMNELSEDLRKFILAQKKKTQTEPEKIMEGPLSAIPNMDFGQSQYLYELLPSVSKLPAITKVIAKLNKKLNQKFFMFLGTINDMKIKDKKFFVFDVDFCIKKPASSLDSYRHEEFRDFYYPFWISTSITEGKLNILVRTVEDGEDVELLNETFLLDKFNNYEQVFEYTAQQILDRDLIGKIPTD